MSARRRWVVVGGGTAGCVVAATLAEHPHHEVVVVEQGPGESGRSPGASVLTDSSVGGPFVRLATRDAGAERTYLVGVGLGGSSRISGALVGLDGDPRERPRELDGAEVVTDDELGPVDRALLRAAPDARHVRLLRRRGELLSVGDVVGLGGHGGPVAVRADKRVTSIRLRGRRAVGVELDGGETIDADSVVLCAGVIGSPALLLRAGVAAPGLGAVREHVGRMIDLVLHPTAGWDPAALVTGVALHRGAAEVMAFNHLGPDLARHGGLLVGWFGGARRGSITFADDPHADPVVDFGGLEGTPDAAGLAVAEGIAASLLDDRAFRSLVVEARPAVTVGGYFHAGSSCAVGSVVDDTGAVVGYDQLYVADAAALADLPADGAMMAAVVTQAGRLARSWLPALDCSWLPALD